MLSKSYVHEEADSYLQSHLSFLSNTDDNWKSVRNKFLRLPNISNEIYNIQDKYQNYIEFLEEACHIRTESVGYYQQEKQYVLNSFTTTLYQVRSLNELLEPLHPRSLFKKSE